MGTNDGWETAEEDADDGWASADEGDDDDTRGSDTPERDEWVETMLGKALLHCPGFLRQPVAQLSHMFETGKWHADGAGRCSPCVVDAGAGELSEWRGKSEPLRELVDGWLSLVDQSGLAEKVREMQESNTWSDQPFLEVEAEAEKVLVDFMKRRGETADFSVRENQPFRLEVISFLCGLVDDPDPEILGMCKGAGVPPCVDEVVPPSGLWPVGRAGELLPTEFEIWDKNYSSMEEGAKEADPDRFRAAIEEKVEAEFSNGFAVRPASVEVRAMGILHGVDETPPADDINPAPDTKVRVTFDASKVGPNARAHLMDCQELPDIMCVISAIFYLMTTIRSLCAIKFDFKGAFKRVPLNKASQAVMGFTWRGTMCHYVTCPFGWRLSSFYWCRLAGCIHRLLKRMIGLFVVNFASFIYVDDELILVSSDQAFRVAAFVFLVLHIMRAPLSWGKSYVGQSPDWSGYYVNLASMVIGLTRVKWLKITKSLRELLQLDQWPLGVTSTLVARLQWFARVFKWIKPFLKKVQYLIALRESKIQARIKKFSRSSDCEKTLAKKFQTAKQQAYVRLCEFKKDVAMWVHVLNRSGCVQRPFAPPPAKGTRRVKVRHDARGSTKQGGLGAYLFGHLQGGAAAFASAPWFSFLFTRENVPLFPGAPDRQPRHMITWLEGLTGIIASRIWGVDPREECYESDSHAFVDATTSFKSKSCLNDLLKETAHDIIVEQKFEADLWEHLPGDDNDVADGLSRKDKFEGVWQFKMDASLRVDIADQLKNFRRSSTMAMEDLVGTQRAISTFGFFDG